MNRVIATGFVSMGALSWFAPNFNGYFFASGNVTEGEGHMTGAIFFVGAAILWFMRTIND